MTRLLARVLALAGLLVLCAGWSAPGAAAAAAAAHAAPAAPAAPAAAAAAWQWPLAGRPVVVRPFVAPSTPYGPGHRGVDLAGAPGTPVLAAGAGVVGYAGLLAGRGVVTVLHSGGLRTTYEPVGASVHSGDRVTRGQRIGTLAAGHAGCGPPGCLHWGLLRGETYLDPLLLLGWGRVRLLPLGGRATVRAGPPDLPGAVGAAGRAGMRSAGSRPESQVDSASSTAYPWPSPSPSLAAGGAAGAALAAAGLMNVRRRWRPAARPARRWPRQV